MRKLAAVAAAVCVLSGIAHAEPVKVLVITGDFSPVQYDVIGTNGNAVKSKQVVSSKTFQLDITSMPAGLYLLRLTDRNGKKKMLKLVKE